MQRFNLDSRMLKEMFFPSSIHAIYLGFVQIKKNVSKVMISEAYIAKEQNPVPNMK